MEIAVREFKDRLSEFLRRAEAGEEIVVTSHGRPVARLSPVAPVAATPEDREAEAIARIGALPWVRPGQAGEPIGLAKPVKLRAGGKTLAQIISEERD